MIDYYVLTLTNNKYRSRIKNILTNSDGGSIAALFINEVEDYSVSESSPPLYFLNNRV